MHKPINPELVTQEMRRALAAMYGKDPVFVLRVYQFYASEAARKQKAD